MYSIFKTLYSIAWKAVCVCIPTNFTVLRLKLFSYFDLLASSPQCERRTSLICVAMPTQMPKNKTKFILKRTRCAAAVPPYYAIHCSFPVSIFSQKKNSKYKLYCILLCRRWSDGRCSGASPSPCPSSVCVRTMCILNFFN